MSRFWRLRYWLATNLIHLGMRVMPASRYRSELNAAMWTLNLKVQAHSAVLGYSLTGSTVLDE